MPAVEHRERFRTKTRERNAVSWRGPQMENSGERRHRSEDRGDWHGDMAPIGRSPGRQNGGAENSRVIRDLPGVLGRRHRKMGADHCDFDEWKERGATSLAGRKATGVHV